ncbi:unnamed protein product [Ectocarpus sp. CCAP 1310/34]|nr:unnamed protein product [Ectocarpus sp. CCAP 1310/34]
MNGRSPLGMAEGLERGRQNESLQ